MKTKMMMLAALFAALTAVGAFIKIPFFLSYITMQVFFTFMAGVLLGGKWAAASQGTYVLLGLLGLPIFTGGGGVTYVFNPTFGFLLALAPAAYVTGKLAGNGRAMRRIPAACLAGLVILYAVGLPYMYVIYNLYMGTGLSAWYVIKAGMLVFLPGDFLKIAVTTILGRRLAAATGLYAKSRD